MSKARIFRRVGALLCALFTAYLLLDTFVIERSYAAASEENSSLFDTGTVLSGTEGGVLCELSCDLSRKDGEKSILLPAGAEMLGSCEGELYTIALYSFRVNDTQIYAADVVTSSAQALKTALAEDTLGRHITAATSEIARTKGAALAINGDFYGARQSGLVIRNGVLYRDSAASDTEVMVLYADGGVSILNGAEADGEELLAAGAWQAFSFGPGLLEDGQISVSESDEVGRAKSSNPRTAIGLIGENHYVFLVSDGRTDESEGLSLYELAQLMEALGCTEAYNLDGGGSSTMVWEGQLVNKPTTNGRRISERSVSDIVYIG